jgi:hypothetical protein
METAGKDSMHVGTKTYYFLGNHAAHANSDDMQLTLVGPAQMINNLQYVFSHLRRRVSCSGLVRVTDTAIVVYKTRVFVSLGVSKIFGLTLPCILHAAKAHDPLRLVSSHILR